MPTRLIFHCVKGHDLTFFVPQDDLGILVIRKHTLYEPEDGLLCPDFKDVRPTLTRQSCGRCEHCIATELEDNEMPAIEEQTFRRLDETQPMKCPCGWVDPPADHTCEFRKPEDNVEKKYMDSDGTKCPYCDSENITADPIQADAGCASGDVHCKSCGKSWKDYYDLAGMGEVE